MTTTQQRRGHVTTKLGYVHFHRHRNNNLINDKCHRRRTTTSHNTRRDPSPAPPPPVARRRRRRRRLQELYESCLSVFKGPETVPSPLDVNNLCTILDNMKPEDVGLTKDLAFFRGESNVGNPKVTMATIYHCNNFSVCIFFVPATAVIPLHDHPGMTVFTKLLWGSMHIKSYDWVLYPTNSMPQRPDQPKLAKLKADSVLTAPGCNSWVLYPTSGGNIHEFKAITPCAVLDVMGPPYSRQHGRDCSYYKDFHYNIYGETIVENGKERECTYGWLEEIEVPEDSRMDVIEYLGPQLEFRM